VCLAILIEKIKMALEDIIKLALGEDGGSGRTTIVALHLAQMREWGIRGGNIEIDPIQDVDNTRKNFIDDLLQKNMIKDRLDFIMDNLVSRGEVLILALPDPTDPDKYVIDYFVGGKDNPDPEYEVIYQPGNSTIIAAVIKSSYDSYLDQQHKVQVDSLPQFKFATNQYFKKWILTVITQKSIYRVFIDQEPQSALSWYAFYFLSAQPNYFQTYGLKSQEFPNPFAPELPFVLCRNTPRKLTDKGVGDFAGVKEQIEEHDDLVTKAHVNLKVFSNPTLVTTRPAQQILEDAFNPLNNTPYWSGGSTWASQNKFTAMPTGNALSGTQPYVIPSIIGNIREAERFGYIQSPDAVSGDQNLWIRQLRELVHWTLGGVDPLGISASATFGEIKSLFGRIENTAMKKSNALLGQNGLCKLVRLIIEREEKKAKFAIINYLITQYLKGKPLVDPNLISGLQDDQYRQIYNFLTQNLNLQLPGLPPLGNRTCSWRYTKQVFEDTTRDLLDRSIVYRNAREDGISQEVAIRQMYPNMTDAEIRNSMSGFSPRVVNDGIQGIATALQLFQQFMQLPDPQDPKAPWGIRLGLANIVEQGVLTLQKEMTFNEPDFQDNPPDPQESLQLIQSAVQTIKSQLSR
jgi:hypothetical protein